MLPNHKLHDEWITDFGVDSDFVRVRVRGLPPRASDLQFIDSDRVFEAQRREAVAMLDDPLVVGVDIARGGSDANVIRFRRGRDGKTIPPIIIPGEETRDSMRMVAKIVSVVTGGYRGLKPDAIFVDGTGIGGPVVDRCRQLGHNVFEIQFGGKSPERQYANMRAYMWGKTKEWLLGGSIDSSDDLELDLTGPLYDHNKRDEVVLESKKSMKDRGLKSPDNGDALALTFAMPVAPVARDRTGTQKANAEAVHDYDPYAD